MIQMKKVLTRYLGDKDNRTLLLNVAGNYLVKGGAMLVSLLMMPAYMRYFESQAVLGMWFTLIQLLNWIMLLDFGIGGGLRNKIVEPLQKGDKDRVGLCCLFFGCRNRFGFNCVAAYCCGAAELV